ncbi:MAG: hypothetical protein R8K22_08425 [Mariprofundaceae bacterium]
MVVILPLILASYYQNQQQFEKQHESTDTLLYFPNEKKSKNYAPGYEKAISNLLWMQTLAYFGTHYAKDQDYRYLVHMLNTITHLNPHHQEAYLMASSILPWMASESEEAIQLLIRGMVSNPKNGMWPYFLGLNLYLFKNNKNVAAHYLQRAIHLGFAVHMTTSLTARLKAETSGIEGAQQWLKEMLRKHKDKNMRAFLNDQLKAVKTEITLRRLDQLIAQLQYKKINIHQLETLKLYIQNWPATLPDGGIITMNKTGQLLSSKSSVRFKLHKSKKIQRLHQGLQ